jgi:hypothetical protein
MKMLNELESDTGDFNTLANQKNAVFDKGRASDASFYKVLDTMANEMKDKQFMKDLTTESQLGHCVVDLTEIGYSYVNLQAAKARASSDKPGANINRAAINYIRFGQGANQRSMSPDLDKIRREIISANNQVQLQGAYELEIQTDPARLNDSIEDFLTRREVPNDQFRSPVAYCSHPDAGTGKVVGIALTYSIRTDVGEAPLAPRTNTIATHDPLMIAQAATGVRYYRFLDRAWAPTFVNTSGTTGVNAGFSDFQTFSTLINMKHNTDITESCKTKSLAADYASPACISTLLGAAINPTTIQTTGIARSFFNSYVGGKWRVYLPDEPLWDKFYAGSKRMYFHMFLKRNVSVAP